MAGNLRADGGRLAQRLSRLAVALAIALPVAATTAGARAAVSGAATTQAAQAVQDVPAVALAGSAAPGLAKAVAGARTTAARVAAIDKVMSELHVDVIDPANGAVVVKGAARSLNDAYLYTNEVERIAVGYAAGERVTLGQLAGELGLAYAKMGVNLTAANLGAGLLPVIKSDSASSVPDSTALVSRLIWQLGLLHKPAQNLAGNVPAAKVSLDPLQAWLVAADFALPLIYGNPPPKSGSQLTALTDGIVGHSAVPSVDACRALKAISEGLSFSDKAVLGTVQDIISKSVTWPELLKKAAPFVPDLVDLVHGILTGIGIQMTSSIDPASTSLGGPPMHLTVGVIMTLHLPQWVVDCGWLAGADFPGHGGVPGVKVVWFNDTLANWGTFDCPAVGCKKTGDDGFARETFTPREEDVKTGVKVVESGTVKALTLVDWSLDNKLGIIADLIRDEGAMVWELSHNEPNFPASFTAHATYNYNGDEGLDENLDLAITGTQEQPAKKYCPPGQDKLCTYTITSMTGTVNAYSCPTSKVPPYHWIYGTTPRWQIQSINKGGALTLNIGLLFNVDEPNGCASGNPDQPTALVAIDDEGSNFTYPPFQPLDTTTKAPLYTYAGIEAGLADVTWTYK
jgi:hypothetical protein